MTRHPADQITFAGIGENRLTTRLPHNLALAHRSSFCEHNFSTSFSFGRLGGRNVNLEDAVGAIRRKRAVALVGAGFSIGAKDAEGRPLPKGNELADEIIAALGSTEKVDYGLAADLFIRTHDEQSLHRFLASRLIVQEISAAQQGFAELQWRRIYTTNFDDTLEFAHREALRPFQALTPRDSPSDTSRSGLWIVHLHGYISEAAQKGGAHALDLSRTSYIDPSLQRTPWPTQLQLDIEAADAVFIVGYSLGDFHIAKLLKATPNTKRKTFIVLENDPSPALAAYIDQFGTVLPIGLDNFVGQAINSPVPEDTGDTEPALICFDEHSLPASTIEPKTEDTIALLLNGRFDDRLYAHVAIHDTPPYTFQRFGAMTAFSRVASGGNRILIHSRVGNGKSVFLRRLAADMVSANRRVFVAKHQTDTAFEEIDRIRSVPGPKAFLFDGLRNYLPSIRYLANELSAEEALVVTARSSEIRGWIDGLWAADAPPFIRAELNSLTDSEIRELDKLLAYYGLWGSMAGRSASSRQRFIRDQCDGELRSVILYLFENSTLGQRIRSALNKVQDASDEEFIAFTAMLIARLADCPLDYFDICQLVNVDSLRTRERLNSSGAGEFFYISDDEFRMRSSVLAEFALSRLVAPDVCLNALLRMVESLSTLVTADERYEHSIPRILRFSVVGRIFEHKSRREFIIGFYEQMLKISLVRKNPQFWLQYAMARMERGEFTLAGRCLENSYNEARRLYNYKTYMIDNQNAKFLLASRIPEDEFKDYDAALRKALPLVENQTTSMTRGLDIHVLRLAEPLRDFKRQFWDRLKPVQRTALQRAMDKLRERTLALVPEADLQDDERRLLQMLG